MNDDDAIIGFQCAGLVSEAIYREKFKPSGSSKGFFYSGSKQVRCLNEAVPQGRFCENCQVDMDRIRESNEAADKYKTEQRQRAHDAAEHLKTHCGGCGNLSRPRDRVYTDYYNASVCPSCIQRIEEARRSPFFNYGLSGSRLYPG